MSREKIIIIGAAGRDFHNFNCVFRDNEKYEVIAFTADIDGRKYPAVLAGKLYPEGIPIHAEAELPELIKKHGIECCVFSYSDVAYEDVMHKASLVNTCGADFKLLGERDTQLVSTKPVISICAVRTGCGKSQTTRRISEILQKAGKKVAAPWSTAGSTMKRS
jgi:predicted GTPase